MVQSSESSSTCAATACQRSAPTGTGPYGRDLAAVLDVIVRILRRLGTGRAFARTLFGDDPDPDQVEFTRRLLAATPNATMIRAPKAA